MSDPFIDEIRQYRDAHAARFNYDLKAIYEDIKRREKEREEKTGCKFVSYPGRVIVIEIVVDLSFIEIGRVGDGLPRRGRQVVGRRRHLKPR